MKYQQIDALTGEVEGQGAHCSSDGLVYAVDGPNTLWSDLMPNARLEEIAKAVVAHWTPEAVLLRRRTVDCERFSPTNLRGLPWILGFVPMRHAGRAGVP